MRWSLLAMILLAACYFAKPAQAQGNSRVVSLTIDGQKQVVATDAGTVKEVLERVGVEPSTHDLIEPAVDTPIDTAIFHINLYRAKAAVVVDGENEVTVLTPYKHPKLIAERSAGISVNPEDGYRFELIRDFIETPAVGQRVIILRSIPVTLTVDGQTFATRTLGKTVAETLDEKGIKLGNEDVVNVDKQTPIAEGMHIIVKRVGREVVAVEEGVPAPVRYIYDGGQDESYQQTQEEGQDGKRLVTYEIVRHDGQVVERKELQAVVLTETKTRVIIKGTRRSSVAGADWAGLRFCESGGDYANKRNPTYRGAYQFSYSTWASVGGSGDPADAPPAEQDMRAETLYRRSGRGQWPVCGPRYLP